MKTAVCTAALILAIVSMAVAQHSVGGWDPDAVEDAKKTLTTFGEKDSGLKKFIDSAAGYVVFPTVGKAAMGIGGAHGKGILFEEGAPIGRSTVTQLTVGFQLGGQAYSEIVFFEDEKALDRFKQGKFEVSAQASAVAVTIGASADLAYSGGVAVVTMAKGGLMYEASIGGQKFSYSPFEVPKESASDAKEEDTAKQDDSD